MAGRTEYTVFSDDPEERSRPKRLTHVPGMDRDGRILARPARGRGAGPGRRGRGAGPGRRGLPRGPRMRQQGEPVSRENVVRGPVRDPVREEEVNPRTGRPRIASVGVDPALLPPSLRRRTHVSRRDLNEATLYDRQLRQSNVGEELNFAIEQAFRTDHLKSEELQKSLIHTYDANVRQVKEILQMFSSFPPGRERLLKLKTSDYVGFLVRFHPLVGEKQVGIRGARGAPERGYKISEIHDLLFRQPLWYFFTPEAGKKTEAEELFNFITKQNPRTVFGRESARSVHSIVLGWYNPDNEETVQIKFERKFTHGDPIQGQALYYEPTFELNVGQQHFRTIQEAASVIARVYGLDFYHYKPARSAFPEISEAFPFSPTPEPVGFTLNDQEDVLKWSNEEVVDWLKRKGFPENVQEAFREDAITGPGLFRLTAVKLREMGITDAKQRTKILKALFDLASVIRVKRQPFLRTLAPLPEAEDLGKGEEETLAKWV
jgi:hypothetical protein